MIIFGLFGKTGCGKTEVLKELKKYHPVIDIEECANTRGSVLGDLYHLKQNDQETFNKNIKNMEKEALKRNYCIVEYEGRKIGGTNKLTIPEPYSDVHKYDYKIIIECPYSQQIERLLNYYIPKNEKEKNILISKFEMLRKVFKRMDKIKSIDEIINHIKNDNYYSAALLIEGKLYREHYIRSAYKSMPDLIIYNDNLKETVNFIDNYINKKLSERGYFG